MKIPRFWIKIRRQGQFSDGRTFELLKYGHSDDSLEQARASAETLATKAVQILSKGVGHLSREVFADYSLAQPIREEILKEYTLQNSRLVITRNGYGSKVLNTDKIMFVDVDLAHHFSGTAALTRLIHFLKTLLMDDAQKARAKRAERTKTPLQNGSKQEQKIFMYLESYCQKNPSFGARIYRTKAGIRLLITSSFFVPDAKETQGLMKELGVDPMYAKICRVQQCFRARLTPKPWRCGHKRPKMRYPYENEEAQFFKQWLVDYESKSANFRTCEYLGSVGSTSTSSDISTCIQIHDSETGATGPQSLKLA
ncbi:MAG: hypothetical protein A2X86_14075 [Bdellovibrionales bacterium GWA2_49_15]|nr:MAG: hypothetical protein A2X86_14075 [Bdellovibrionales bacterium GWA2_49_15]HAZ11530.1 hypothetical protein [Bdellovibrionales bacterium]